MSAYIVHPGEVAFDQNDTDEDLRRRAEEYLPTAMERAGRAAAEETWTVASGEIADAGFTFDGSKEDFVSEGAREFLQNASAADYDEMRRSIFEQLKEHRDRAKAPT
jgi:hypothetical protein